MAWEHRAGCGPYYYKPTWRDGRPHREYYGSGLVGQLAAELDDVERAERSARLKARRAEAARLEEADRPIRPHQSALGLVLEAGMAAAGFHRHARGQWRKWCHAPEA